MISAAISSGAGAYSPAPTARFSSAIRVSLGIRHTIHRNGGAI
jgi:hypothetical protein